MSRASKPAKSGRRERHLARQSALKAAKRLRRERAAKFAHLPGQQPTHGADRVRPRGRVGYPIKMLPDLSMPELRIVAANAGCKVLSRNRKAELIAIIEAAQEGVS